MTDYMIAALAAWIIFFAFAMALIGPIDHAVDLLFYPPHPMPLWAQLSVASITASVTLAIAAGRLT